VNDQPVCCQVRIRRSWYARPFGLKPILDLKAILALQTLAGLEVGDAFQALGSLIDHADDHAAPDIALRAFWLVMTCKVAISTMSRGAGVLDTAPWPSSRTSGWLEATAVAASCIMQVPCTIPDMSGYLHSTRTAILLAARIANEGHPDFRDPAA